MYCLRKVISHLRHAHHTKLFVRPVQNARVYTKPQFFSTQVESQDDQVVHSICNGDAELEKKLKIIMLEVEVMRQDGRCAPDNLKADQWEHLLSLPSRNQRSNYLSFLWKTEKSRENQKAKKEARRKELEENPLIISKENPDDLLYGITHQSLFIRIRDQSINMFDNYRALQAMIHGQSVIIDCSYEEHMVFREITNAAKQMTFVFGDNRIHKNPFNLHMCNVNLGGLFMKQLRKNIPSLEEPWFPLNIHTESYLDKFPKDKLVYLTPHCRDELTYFDHDAIYIVGCMVDKVNNEPLSLAKAKRDGLKMAKLPLDRYIEWAPGSNKNLNINHMIPILLDLKNTGDWEYSLKHIPRRKLMETKIFSMEQKLKRKPFRDDPFNDFRPPKGVRLNLQQQKAKSRKTLYDDENI